MASSPLPASTGSSAAASSPCFGREGEAPASALNPVYGEIDLAGNPVWETSVPPLSAQTIFGEAPLSILGLHQDAQRLPDGSLAIIAYTTRCLPCGGASCGVGCGSAAEQLWMGDAIVVVARDGR